MTWRWLREILLLKTEEEEALHLAALRAIGGPFARLDPEAAALKRAWIQTQDGHLWRKYLHQWVDYFERVWAEDHRFQARSVRAQSILSEKTGVRS